jgi:adenine-specific DNA-methyltransferase
LPAFATPPWTLEDYGYEPKTGYLVPHRMPVPRLKNKGNRLWVCPLIWATQIGSDGVHRFQVGRGEHAYIYVDVSIHGHDRVLTVPSVAVQRTSSKDQAQRVRCAPITQEFVKAHGGYIGENHVCFLVPIAGRQPVVSVEVLATILNSDPVDRMFRCLSGTATVSAYELRAMPMPDPAVVSKELEAGSSPSEAALKGYKAALEIPASARKAA